MAIGSPQWMYASGEDFTIDQSLRFNDDDSANLSWTPASAGNRRTWTFSCWVKRGNLGINSRIINTTDPYEDMIKFTSADKLNIYCGDSTGYTNLLTTQVFRDTSAWYHIVFAIDTTQGTASNRAKLYVNGSQITAFDTETYASLNMDSEFNDATLHIMGYYSDSPSEYMEGYLAEVHFIDGTQLTPTSFGETGDYGEWKPIEVSGLTYGTNGFYLSFAGGGVMTATGGNSTATDGDYKAASFTADGTFTPSADGYVEYLVIAGGGGGGGQSTYYGSGGGAGGYRTGYLPVTASTAYSITVGDGGAAQTKGSNSVFSTITSTGGGRGTTTSASGTAYSTDIDGGSGGGDGTYNQEPEGSGIAGQGNDGGGGHTGAGAGGGGGAGAVGGSTTSGTGAAGGAGLASSITGSSVTRAGGGGGGGWSGSGAGDALGGAGGGGKGNGNGVAGTAGTTNTGSGGGGGGYSAAGGAGGSGIVILRYRFQ